MKASTPILACAIVALVGGATLWLAATKGQDDVRFVEQVLADPGAHRDGSYVLMGIPQPLEVPYTGPNGTTLRPNPDYAPQTSWTTAWTRDGTRYYSTHTLELVAGTPAHWRATNTTRLTPADAEPAFPVASVDVPVPAGMTAYPFEAFTDGARTRLWAIMPGHPETPIQPKPSQLRGHLLSALPDGTPLPAWADVFWVDEFTAGCSSKFLPPELKEKYADEGNA